MLQGLCRDLFELILQLKHTFNCLTNSNIRIMHIIHPPKTILLTYPTAKKLPSRLRHFIEARKKKTERPVHPILRFLKPYRSFRAFELSCSSPHDVSYSYFELTAHANRQCRIVIASSRQSTFLVHINLKPLSTTYSHTFFALVSLSLRSRPVQHLIMKENIRKVESKSLLNDISFPREDANSVEIFLNFICFNRLRNQAASSSALQSLLDYVLCNGKFTMTLLDSRFFIHLVTLVLGSKLTENVKAFLSLCFILSKRDEQRGSPMLHAVMMTFFQVPLWVELNEWMRAAIEDDDQYLDKPTTVRNICQLYIYLSKFREARLKKLPQPVLDFLIFRTHHVINALKKFVKGHESLVLVLLEHLTLMIGSHSECRWKFRQMEGVNVIVTVMESHVHEKYVNMYCCDILNMVVEGILKRKLRIFKKKELTYTLIVNCLVNFAHCRDITEKICNFLRKVINFCPDDTEYLQNANARNAVERIRETYANDPIVHTTASQLIIVFDSYTREKKPKRSKSKKLRKSKQLKQTAKTNEENELTAHESRDCIHLHDRNVIHFSN